MSAEVVSYRQMHRRIRVARGNPERYPCAHECGRTAQEWAYDRTDPAPVAGATQVTDSEIVYSLDPARYLPLCVPCHRAFDAPHCPLGSPRRTRPMTATRRAYGPTVRAVRNARGLIMSAAADAAGLSKGYWSKVENGQRRPDVDATASIATALDVDPAVLTGQLPVIATLREAQKISAADFADRIGITTETLARIERGTERPHAEVTADIAARLGVDPDALNAAAPLPARTV